jgi:hypothetical protein
VIGALTGVVAGLSILAAPAPAGQPGSCDGQQQLSPDELVACLQVGPVDLAGATITGPLDLTAVDVVPYPFRCVDCTFSGDVNVADVTFERLVAFERVFIRGDLDARGARFAGAVLARGQREGDEPSGIEGDANFSLARFDEALQLDSTTFGGAVTFESARFAGAVTMSGTDLLGPANFDRIVAAESFSIGGPDPFDPTGPNGVAQDVVTMQNATFEGDLDLGARSYHSGLIATGARVGGRLTLRSAVVTGNADLERVTVNDLDATGLEVIGPPTPCAQRVSEAGSGTLDLSDLRAESITLAQAVVDELVLQGAQVAGRANVELALLTCEASFDGLSADSLTVDLAAVDRAGPAARQSMYKTIVDTAKEAGDLELANEATYRRYVDLNRDDAWPKATLDNIFYRGMAGYMVKPLRPLVCLLVLWLAGTVVRFVTSPRQTAGGPPLTIADSLGVALGEAGRAIIRPTPKLPQGANLLTWPSIGRLAEYLASKILLVILVISISNNSTALDKIVEAVLP